MNPAPRKASKVLSVLSILLTLVLLAIQNGASPKSLATVSITFVDCASAKPYRLFVSATNLKTHKETSFYLKHRSGRIQMATLDLRAGLYYITASSKTCYQMVEVPVAAGTATDETLFGMPTALVLGNGAAIAGTLPFKGLRVALVFPGVKGNQGYCGSAEGFLQLPLTVNGNRYFGSNIPRRRAIIRVFDGSGRRYVDVGTVTFSKTVRLLQHNVQKADLESGAIRGV